MYELECIFPFYFRLWFQQGLRNGSPAVFWSQLNPCFLYICAEFLCRNNPESVGRRQVGPKGLQCLPQAMKPAAYAAADLTAETATRPFGLERRRSLGFEVPLGQKCRVLALLAGRRCARPQPADSQWVVTVRPLLAIRGIPAMLNAVWALSGCRCRRLVQPSWFSLLGQVLVPGPGSHNNKNVSQCWVKHRVY